MNISMCSPMYIYIYCGVQLGDVTLKPREMCVKLRVLCEGWKV